MIHLDDPSLVQFGLDFTKELFKVLAGGVVGYLIKDRGVKKAKLVDNAKEELRNISAETVRYWEKNGLDADAEDEIKKSFTRFNHLLDDVTRKFGSKKKCLAVHAKHTALYDLATGGEFERAKRKADSAMATACKTASIELDDALSRL